MEEYFPPMGTDHQILDGREARPRAVVFVLGGLGLLLVLLGALGWWKQRTHSFAVPKSLITIDYSQKAAHWLRDEERLPLPEEWRSSGRPGLLPRFVGGTATAPTWILAPRWARVPENWEKQESFGLYRVFAHPDASATTTALALRDRRGWSLDLRSVVLRGQVQLDGQTVAFAINNEVLTTSFPASKPDIKLLSGYDASYILHNPVLDAALLQRFVLSDQGLAPWRPDIARLAWNTPTGTLTSWSLEARHASSSLLQLLATSSTVQRTSLLPDGSASIRRHVTSTSTLTLLQEGDRTDAPLTDCANSDFHPFFHLSGASLAHTWSRISARQPSLLQIGELDGRLSVCFIADVDVDK